MQQLESLAYEAKPVREQEMTVYQSRDLEGLSAVTLSYGSGGSPLGSPGAFGIVKTPKMKEDLGVDSVRPARSTEYFRFSDTGDMTIGITHHSEGLGKLKVHDPKTDKEYGVPITDILNKILKDWRVNKK